MKTCSICIEESSDLLRISCNHEFCKECLNKLVLFSINCPNCRKEFTSMEIALMRPKSRNARWFHDHKGETYLLRDPLASIMEMALMTPRPHLMRRFRWHDLTIDTHDMIVFHSRTFKYLGRLFRTLHVELIMTQKVLDIIRGK